MIGEIDGSYLVLPTFPAFTDQIPETRELPEADKINTDHSMVKDIMLKTCKNIQFRVNDENNEIAGYIADDLFYPSLSIDITS